MWIPESSGRGQPGFFMPPHITARISPPTPAPLLAGGELWDLSRPGGFLCFCKSLKWPIFSFAALLSPHNIFFSCSEIHSPSLEMWALYRKSLACTSTNGWALFPVCSPWCCKGIAKNYRRRHKSKKWMGTNVGILTCTFTNMIKSILTGRETPQSGLLAHCQHPESLMHGRRKRKIWPDDVI